MVKPVDPEVRAPRADAARNRGRILQAAKQAFTEQGSNAGLDEIARNAGVGSATLYRHFPTREGLIEAVYRAEIERLATAADTLGQTETPTEALRQWMLLFVDYMASKQIIAPVFNSIPGGSERLYMSASELILQAVGNLVRRAVDAGEMRSDLDPWDLLQPLIGVSLVSAGQEWPSRAQKLVGLLVRGSLSN